MVFPLNGGKGIVSCVNRPDILSKIQVPTPTDNPPVLPDTMTGEVFPLQITNKLYVPLMDFITPKVEPLSEDRYRIELFSSNGGEYYGVLFYERAKRGYNNKPITKGWTCVDASVQQKLYNDNPEVTPLQVLQWGMSLVNQQ